MEHTQDNPEWLANAERLVNLKQVAELTNLHRTSIWRLQAAGKFPHDVNTGIRRKKVWRLSSVETWIRNLEPAPLPHSQYSKY